VFAPVGGHALVDHPGQLIKQGLRIAILAHGLKTAVQALRRRAVFMSVTCFRARACCEHKRRPNCAEAIM
jgi:hypothetical protein